MTPLKAIIAGLLLLVSIPAAGQSVGLALSGGGAKGLYHIGVIRALEENGIPIDYVAGTSMGAVIGSLYAAGYSPQEMAAIFYSDQVNYWMSGRIENKYFYYFTRSRPSAAMVTLRLDLERERNSRHARLRLPTSVIPSRQIDMAFVNFFSAPNAVCGGNFDQLFVPFRCVASDAANRREVIFRDGDLGKAVRASMTLPLVFRPLKGDSTLYYDGGIYNNFPWEVLRDDFAPDIIIGSKCVEGNSELDENSIIDQVFALTMMHTEYELPGEKDILIERVFEDVSLLDFSKASYVIERGFQDAMAVMPVIKERIERRVDTVELQARRQRFRSREPELVFDRFKIEGLNETQTDYAEGMLRLDDRPGKRAEFDFEEFRSSYFRLLSEGEIDGDYPGVSYNDTTGMFGLSLNLRTKPSFKVMIGGNISSTSMNQAYLGLEYKLIRRSAHTFSLDGYLSALYSSAQLGGTSRMFFGRRQLAVDYRFNYNFYNYFKSDFGGLGKNNDLFYNKLSDVYWATGLRIPTTRSTQMALRVHLGRNMYRNYNTPNFLKDDVMDRTRFLFVGAQAEFDRNGLNYLIYPTRGLRQTISAIFIHGKETYYAGSTAPNGIQPGEDHRRTWFGGHFAREQYFSLANWFAAGYLVEAVGTNQPDFANVDSPNALAPAFTPTQHSNFVYLPDFRSRSFFAGGIMPIFESSSRFFLKTSAYVFVPEEALKKKKEDPIEKRVRYIFNASLVYQTPIGPAGLSLSKYDASSNHNWFLTFNFGFTIFNRRGVFY